MKNSKLSRFVHINETTCNGGLHRVLIEKIIEDSLSKKASAVLNRSALSDDLIHSLS